MSKNFLTEDEIDAKLAGGGVVANIVAHYRIIGTTSSSSVTITKLRGQSVLGAGIIVKAGIYEINHKFDSAKFIVIPIGIGNSNGTASATTIPTVMKTATTIRLTLINLAGINVNGSCELLFLQ